MKIIELQQGTPEWHAHRATHFNASEAPAMMGVSPYKTRSQLLKERATGLMPEVDAATQRRFDDGHRFEALARPLAEQIIGEDLFPVVGEEGEYSASFDGLTMGEDIVFEHKSLNEEIRACQAAADLPIYYRIQMEQQLSISGAGKCLFMATKWDANDQLIEKKYFWFEPDLGLRNDIGRGWSQFKIDVAEYQHVEVIPAAVAAPIADLPALVVEITGAVTASNLAAWNGIVTERIRSINTDLQTDQHFADADQMVKFLGDGEKKLDMVKSQALAQTASIDTLFRTIDNLQAEMKAKRLELNRLVEARKVAIKSEIVMEGKSAYEAHINALKAETDGIWIVLPAPDFGGAIKNKRNLAAMRDAVDLALVNGKIAADESAQRIRANLACLKNDGAGFEFLFSDRLALVSKAHEDLAMLVRLRIADHQAAEQTRLDAEREKIRAEEEAKAAAKVKAEQEAAQQAAAIPVAAAPACISDSAKSDTQPALSVASETQPAPNSSIAAPTPAPALTFAPAPNTVDTGARIKLGDINLRLSPLAVTADMLAALGFQTAGKEGASKLYRASDFQAICAAIIRHVQTAATNSHLRRAA